MGQAEGAADGARPEGRRGGGDAAARREAVLAVADYEFADEVGVFLLLGGPDGAARSALLARDDVAHAARTFRVDRVIVTRDAAVACECRAAGLRVDVRRAVFARPLVGAARSLCGAAAADVVAAEGLL